MLKERVVTFGPGSILIGIETWPSDDRAKANLPAVILLNAGVVHRVGPHRMTVTLARRLAQAGFHVLRYDRSGLGDSQPRARGNAADAAVADGQAAMDHLTATTGRNLFVFGGLCSGADNSVNVALADKRVAGMILLDPFGYRTPRFYLQRFRDRGGDLGVLIGYAHRHLGASLRRWLGRWLPDRRETNALKTPPPAYRRRQPPREVFGAQLRRLTDRGVRILAIYTGSAGDRYNYAEQFADGFRAFGLADRVDCEYLREVNHTFTELAAQQLLCSRVGGWMERTFSASVASDAPPRASVQRAVAEARMPEQGASIHHELKARAEQLAHRLRDHLTRPREMSAAALIQCQMDLVRTQLELMARWRLGVQQRRTRDESLPSAGPVTGA